MESGEISTLLERNMRHDFTGKPPFTRETMQRYVAYLRVSTPKQGFSGLGLEAQRSAVQDYVQRENGILLEEFVEVESGSLRNRPGLAQAIATCRAEKSILIIAKLDRLARNVAFVSSLLETGVEFVAADAPFANKLMIHILSAFAEHERAMISERTRAALAAARARGVVLGANGRKLAAGYRKEAADFAETVRTPVLDALGKGLATLGAIAEDLNTRGIRTRENARWSAASVHRLMGRLDLRTPTVRRRS